MFCSAVCCCRLLPHYTHVILRTTTHRIPHHFLPAHSLFLCQHATDFGCAFPAQHTCHYCLPPPPLPVTFPAPPACHRSATCTPLHLPAACFCLEPAVHPSFFSCLLPRTQLDFHTHCLPVPPAFYTYLPVAFSPACLCLPLPFSVKHCFCYLPARTTAATLMNNTTPVLPAITTNTTYHSLFLPIPGLLPSTLLWTVPSWFLLPVDNSFVQNYFTCMPPPPVGTLYLFTISLPPCSYATLYHTAPSIYRCSHALSFRFPSFSTGPPLVACAFSLY